MFGGVSDEDYARSRTWLLLVCFFFQAEDGIRDLTVTGVQTCALPIWQRARRGRERHHREAAPHFLETDGRHPHLHHGPRDVRGQGWRRRAPEPRQIGRASCRERV